MIALKDFQSNLSDLIKEKVNLYVCDIGLGDISMLMATKIRPQTRLIKDYNLDTLIFSVRIENVGTIGYAKMTEFPNCCGKVILYGLSINNNYYKLGVIGRTDISDENYNKYVDGFINICLECAKHMGYTSLDMIISEHEQKKLYEAIIAIGYKPVSTFSNQRMPNKNICHNFTINIKFG